VDSGEGGEKNVKRAHGENGVESDRRGRGSDRDGGGGVRSGIRPAWSWRSDCWGGELSAR